MDRDDSDDGVFVSLFEDFYPDLLKITWRIVGRIEVAEELCQEAFLRYYERRDGLPSGNEARYWLIRVVRNLALNHEKRRRKERDVYQEYRLQPRREVENEGEQSVLQAESREQVHRAVLSLPYKQRMVLVLKEYSGFSYADIAKILRLSVSNVKVRMFRARQQLEKILNKGDVYVP